MIDANKRKKTIARPSLAIMGNPLRFMMIATFIIASIKTLNFLRLAGFSSIFPLPVFVSERGLDLQNHYVHRTPLAFTFGCPPHISNVRFKRLKELELKSRNKTVLIILLPE